MAQDSIFKRSKTLRMQAFRASHTCVSIFLGALDGVLWRAGAETERLVERQGHTL